MLWEIFFILGLVFLVNRLVGLIRLIDGNIWLLMSKICLYFSC